MAAPKLPTQTPGTFPIKTGINSENSFHPERPINYKPIKNEVRAYVWQLPVRIFHWVNMLAILLLMGTGVYIGKPFSAAIIPGEAYYSNLMGWVRYVHFFAAFLFTLNLIFRLYWVWKGNKFATSNPLRWVFWKELFETVKFYLFLKNKKPHYVGHNPLAQLSYWIFIGLGSWIVMLTGFYMYFEPQQESFWAKLFVWVPSLFGGDSYTLRSWHHLTAWGFMLFIVIHVYMAFRDDYLERNGSISSMFSGYKTTTRKSVGEKTMNRNEQTHITILGIGNTLFTDEGVGIHLLPLLEDAFKDDENIELIEGLTDGMKLLGPVEDAENLIIIDAINAGKEGGTIITLKGDEIPAYFGIKMSIHQLGFQEVLLAAKMRERYPRNIVMFGMQPTSLQMGIELTETNREKLGDLAQAVINQVRSWREPL